MPPKAARNDSKTDLQQSDWYFENGLLAYTATFHSKRSHYCGSGCRHCPYEPKHVEGNRKVVTCPLIGAIHHRVISMTLFDKGDSVLKRMASTRSSLDAVEH
jgi:hypothetical protein